MKGCQVHYLLLSVELWNYDLAFLFLRLATVILSHLALKEVVHCLDAKTQNFYERP